LHSSSIVMRAGSSRQALSSNSLRFVKLPSS
jgi:hypothetical protein